MPTTELECAWAAGFFDGEGWSGTTILNKKPWHPGYLYVAASVGQMKRGPLERFAAAVGVGKVYGPDKTGRFIWQVKGGAAMQAMDAMLPYLGPVKTEQWRVALAKYEADIAATPRPNKGNARRGIAGVGAAVAPHTLPCTKCGLRKPIQDFSKDPRTPGRGCRKSWCRRCVSDGENPRAKNRRKERRLSASLA